MFRRWPPAWLALLTLSMELMVTAGCGKPSVQPQPGEGQSSNRSLVRIGNEDYTASQFEAFLHERFPESTIPLPRNDRVLSELLDRAINERLLLQAAREHQITVPDREVQEYLTNAEIIQNSNHAKVRDISGPQRFAHAREILMVNHYLQSMGSVRKGISVTDEKKYYESHPAAFQEPERYHVGEILVKDEPLARAIKGMLAKGKSFDSLARRYSTNELASKGGDLGWFARGELPEQFEKAVVGLKPGEHSRIIQTDYGFHIFKLKAIQAGHQIPFEKARREIQSLLTNERRQKVVARDVARLRKATPIAIQFQNLGFKYTPE